MTGWQCPCCRAVNAPFVQQCPCNGQQAWPTQFPKSPSIPSQPYSIPTGPSDSPPGTVITSVCTISQQVQSGEYLGQFTTKNREGGDQCDMPPPSQL